MSPIVLPSAEAFRRAGWIAPDQSTYDNLVATLVNEARERIEKGKPLLSKVQAFKEFIETDPVVFTEFIRMFEKAEEPGPIDYVELVYTLDVIFRRSPEPGHIGPPVYMVMAQNMNTQGGFSAYTKEVLNKHFKEILVAWTRYLESKDSRKVLNESEKGWFWPKSLEKMLEGYPEGRTFEQVFVCDPKAPYYGYNSFEEFFNRRYKDVACDRPIKCPDDLSYISIPCEANAYAYLTNVQKSDKLYIKSEAYSLVHLLAKDPYTDKFIGGQVYQGFLNTPGYHRWHSPVTGTIKKIVDVPGTYFAQAPSVIGETIPPADSNEVPPYLKSLVFFANTAARQLIFIDSDNHKLGLVCFIAIGMTEIASCEATVHEGQKVKRGDELGMFHFGGSSFALLFRRDANVIIEKDLIVREGQTNIAIKINAKLGTVPT